MANELPIIVPPRTPSPLSEEEKAQIGLGIAGASGGSRASNTPARLNFDFSTLSPPDAPSSVGSDNMLSPDFSTTFSPVVGGSLNTPATPYSASSDKHFPVIEDGSDESSNPFNFTTQQYTAGRAGSFSRDVGKRRGHKYKHSSISHQIFLEPAPKAPLQLPAALPMPTRLEVRKSMTSEQRSRLFWCFCHFAVAAYVQWSAHGSLAMTALSRLLFFDAAGAVACVVVDMMGNFEVWKRSSIRHPFGYVTNYNVSLWHC